MAASQASTMLSQAHVHWIAILPVVFAWQWPCEPIRQPGYVLRQCNQSGSSLSGAYTSSVCHPSYLAHTSHASSESPQLFRSPTRCAAEGPAKTPKPILSANAEKTQLKSPAKTTEDRKGCELSRASSCFQILSLFAMVSFCCSPPNGRACW